MFATLLGITGGGAPPRRDFVPGRDSAGDTGKKSSDTDHDSDAEGGQSPFSDEYFYKYLKETTTLTQASKKIYMNQIKKNSDRVLASQGQHLVRPESAR